MSNRMRRPNIIVITPHDTGRHFECYGVPSVSTPNVDRLAASGVMFANMYATSSVCAPSRCSLLTGCYPQTHGVMSLVGGAWNWTLSDPRRHLSHVLRAAGYHTRIYGYQDEAVDLADLGFDESGSYLGPRMPEKVIDAVQMADDVAAYIGRASRSAEGPFYVQVGFFETHIPYDYGGVQPDRSRGVWIPPACLSSGPAIEADLAMLQGAVRKMDRGVGIILDALERAGIERDTLVLFAVDHGVDVPRAKRTMYNAGLETAFIMRWPAGGIEGGKRCSWLLSNVDFLPTLSELLDFQPAHTMEGMSFASAFDGRAELAGNGPREAIYAMWSETEEYAVRTADYKLIRKFKPERPREGTPGRYELVPPQRLFHLPTDPYEQNDVSADPAYAGVLADMNSRFYRWIDEVSDPIRNGPIPTPYYRKAIEGYLRYRAGRQPESD